MQPAFGILYNMCDVTNPCGPCCLLACILQEVRHNTHAAVHINKSCIDRGFTSAIGYFSKNSARAFKYTNLYLAIPPLKISNLKIWYENVPNISLFKKHLNLCPFVKDNKLFGLHSDFWKGSLQNCFRARSLNCPITLWLKKNSRL